MSLPQRRFYPIAELADVWETQSSVLIDYAVDHRLEICVRLFGIRAELHEGEVPGYEPINVISTEVLAGVYPLLPADLWRVRCHGIARVRTFASRDRARIWFKATDDQPDVEITTPALLITAGERERFETKYELTSERSERDPFVHSPDYRTITLNGRQFVLSATRARIVAALHEAWRTGRPWMEKDAVLQAANSSGSRIADVFTDTDERGRILVADNRGNWRINLPLPRMRNSAFRRMGRKSHLTLVKS